MTFISGQQALNHQLCALCMEEAWNAEENVSVLEEVDVFIIFSSVFVWDYAE